MPWATKSTMSLRSEFVHLALSEGANIRSLTRRFGISPKTAYKWLDRFRYGGLEALQDQSRRPHYSPVQTSDELEKAIVELRQQHRQWGARKLRARLLTLGWATVPSISTITAILHRHGCIDAVEAHKHHAWQRFEAQEPNALWQMDFKGHFAIRAGRCHPLTILDDCSRYNLGLLACANETRQIVQQHLRTIFRHYGLPQRMLVDNGSPWGTHGGDRYTTLTVWLLQLGVSISHARVYHPQTLGKDERFHRTLKAELLQGTLFDSLEHCQERFDQWRHCYNTERPHEALGLVPPSSRYRPSLREFPETLQAIVYGPDDIIRKVQDKGDISFHGTIFILGKAFRGYPVALRPTLIDGIFDVYFCKEQIAQINLNDNI